LANTVRDVDSVTYQPASLDEFSLGENHQNAVARLRDHNGQQLAYVYFEDEPGRRSKSRAHPL
jgi:hypothetical protein